MSLYGAVAENERQGKELKCGIGALAAVTGILAITTEFDTIDSVVATVQKATAPTTSALTYSVSGSTVTIHGWMATAADDTALIASTAEESVSYIIMGRRRQ